MSHVENEKREIGYRKNKSEAEMQEEEEEEEAGINDEIKEEVNGESFELKEEEFKILGDVKKSKHLKVYRDLPAWIRDGVCIKNAGDIDESAKLENVTFMDEDIKSALKAIDGFNYLFPVQMHVIPAILESTSSLFLPPSDICCAAPTGSGKTFAYLLPLIQILRKRFLSKTLGAIVMTPTRGLASQVAAVAIKYGSRLGVKISELSVTGTIEDDTAILICTPGRFSSALPHLNVANLRYLVLDESDRLLSDDRHGWFSQLNMSIAQHSKTAGVERLQLGKLWSISELTSGYLPLQRLMFSATFTANPTWLAPMCLVRPRLYSVEPTASTKPHIAAKMLSREDAPAGAPLPTNLSEFMAECTTSTKPLVLIKLLVSKNLLEECPDVLTPAMIFVNSSRSANRLSIMLNALNLSHGLRSANFTGRCGSKKLKNLSQRITEKKLDLIVCTDVAARGFDCKELVSVINYELPTHSRTYIHRAGRTARAGRSGNVFSLVTHSEKRHWLEVVTGANRKKNVHNLKFRESDLEPYRVKFVDAIRTTAQKIKSKYNSRPKKQKRQIVEG